MDHDHDELKQALMAALGDDPMEMWGDDEIDDIPPHELTELKTVKSRFF